MGGNVTLGRKMPLSAQPLTCCVDCACLAVNTPHFSSCLEDADVSVPIECDCFNCLVASAPPPAECGGSTATVSHRGIPVSCSCVAHSASQGEENSDICTPTYTPDGGCFPSESSFALPRRGSTCSAGSSSKWLNSSPKSSGVQTHFSEMLAVHRTGGGLQLDASGCRAVSKDGDDLGHTRSHSGESSAQLEDELVALVPITHFAEDGQLGSLPELTHCMKSSGKEDILIAKNVRREVVREDIDVSLVMADHSVPTLPANDGKLRKMLYFEDEMFLLNQIN